MAKGLSGGLTCQDLKRRMDTVSDWIETCYLNSLSVECDSQAYTIKIGIEAISAEFSASDIRQIIRLKKLDATGRKDQLARVLARHVVKMLVERHSDRIAASKELEDTVKIICDDGTWYVQHKHTGQTERAYERTQIDRTLALAMLRAVSDILNEGEDQ